MKILLVIDMQKDFIDGALGTGEAVKILDPVKEKIRKAKAQGTDIVFTKDTHYKDYLMTQEGRKLPVPHCVKGTEGWELDRGLLELAQKAGYEEIELIGLCTDICVISNAMILKAALPEAVVRVDPSCCAGVTPESHRNALEAMKVCQIEVV